jgi:hypothetical protein
VVVSKRDTARRPVPVNDPFPKTAGQVAASREASALVRANKPAAAPALKRQRRQAPFGAVGAASGAVGLGGLAVNRYASGKVKGAEAADKIRHQGLQDQVDIAERRGKVARSGQSSATRRTNAAGKRVSEMDVALNGKHSVSHVEVDGKPVSLGTTAGRERATAHLEELKRQHEVAGHEQESAFRARSASEKETKAAHEGLAGYKPQAGKVKAKFTPMARKGKWAAAAGGVGALASLAGFERSRHTMRDQVKRERARSMVSVKQGAPVAAPTADAGKKRAFARSVKGGPDLKWSQKQVGEWGH